MKPVLRLVLINVGTGILMLIGWLAQRPRGEISPVTDILFPLGIGLVTYYAGRLNGAAWLSVPLARVLIQRFDTDAVVSSLECLLVYVFSGALLVRQAQAAMARDQLRAVIGSMEDVVLLLDREGRYREVAPSAGLVRPAEELVGRNLTDIFGPPQATFFLDKIRETLDTQRTVSVDYSLVIDGRERWFNAAVSPMAGEQVVWVARDVTQTRTAEDALQRLNEELEQRIAERTRELAETIEALHGEVAARVKAIAALTESQERFQLVARATDDVIWDWDLTTGELWLSDAFGARFGGEAHPDMDQFFERIHQDDRERVHKKLEESLQSDDAKFSSEYRLRRADGSYAVILDRGHVARDDAGTAKRMIGAMIDLSDHHRLMERLEQEKRVSGLGRIAASIAHEFNNLTMGIQSNLETVRRLSVPEMKPALDYVFAAINRSKGITDQILRYTRPTPPETRAVSVKRLLEDWKEEISSALPPSIEVSVTVTDPLLLVEADPLQIKQVLTNLGLNSRDAMLPHGGRLTIDAFAETEGSHDGSAHRMVHFRFADTGCGMTSETLSSAFEPLFTTKRHGTGLGLAVSQQIAIQNRGHLSAESRQGEGTTFHLLLPASQATEVVTPLAESATFSCERILLVEDDLAVAAGLTTLLETSGVKVTVSHDGAGALALAESTNPDCVILDVGLPDLPGTEVFDRIRARFPALPVIFSSGHTDASALKPYLDKGRVALLVKPYTFAELTATLSLVAGGSVRP